jgi:phthalate 4,5-dioxygenase oxygenase subunit
MITHEENELMTRVEGDAPMGRMMREHYWIPFALSENLEPGAAPTPVRLLGENFVAFRSPDGRIGFLDERCPHRRSSLLLARVEGDGLRCIYHGWKVDVSGCVVEAPTQTIRPERFCASVPVTHFPVHEEAGIAWVWLGGAEAPAFPDLPFNDAYGFETVMTISTVPANWLQGLEGGIDSVHGTILHRAAIEAVMKARGEADTEGVRATFAAPPLYETEETPFGMRQASLRPAAGGGRYVRLAHFFFPLVVVVPNGYEGATHLFAFAPIDDTNHLVFFGNYGPKPLNLREVSGADDDLVIDRHSFARVSGDRLSRWGQDRELVANGHWSGITGSVIAEDAVVQASMGPIVDRTKENLSSSDVAIAHARRLILSTIAAVEAGELPPGSALDPGGVHVPPPFDAVLDDGESWRELEAAR